ncbi:MAG: ABC transporter permease [Dehalococcoidia bacterium]|jgi:putative ABC transport system permease protein
MSVWESLKTAFNAIWTNKMRSALTMLGIVIGVCAVVLLVSLGQGFQTSMTNTFNALGASAVYISTSTDKTLSTVRPLTLDDANALMDKTLAPAIGVVAPTINKGVTVQFGTVSDSLQATGCTPAYAQIKSYPIQYGRFINDQDITDRSSVVVLGWQTDQDLFAGGDPSGQSVRVAGQKFQVIGSFQKLGGMQGDGYILMPLSTMQSKMVGGTNVQTIAVKATTSDDVDTAEAEITSILNARHYIKPGGTSDFTIRDMRQTLQNMEATLAGFSLFMGAVGAISLIVGGIGIMNIMLVSVTERTREIGIRKAIGAKRRDILLQFLIEAATLSLSGGLIGLGMAMAGAMAMGHVTIGNAQVVPEISASIVIIALGVSIGTGLLSGTYPAFRAAQLDPIESLRHE